jgi:hypothetical protein
MGPCYAAGMIIRLGRSWLLHVALLAACSASNSATKTEDWPVASQDAGDSAECQEGQIQPCPCGAESGYQTCSDGAFGACECPIEPLDAGPYEEPSTCAPGRYEGTFDGWAGFLIASTPVSGIDFSGMPALVLDLQEPPPGAELFVVGNGFMKGNANGTFPFEANIQGQLDCSTQEFNGEVRGSVQLLVDGIDNQFTGTMTAKYDVEQQAFVEGIWTVQGTSADGGLDLGLTGNGVWNALHAGSAPDAGAP